MIKKINWLVTVIINWVFLFVAVSVQFLDLGERSDWSDGEAEAIFWITIGIHIIIYKIDNLKFKSDA